jgi:hypothetical protein
MAKPALWVLVLSAVAAACTGGFSPEPTPQVVAAMPDTIPCTRAVLVKAGSERKGVAAERRWLAAFYPDHGPYSQALQIGEHPTYDVLAFDRADGRAASVCFDITSFYGRY